jgi:LPS export ABC transporter permease LptG
MPMLVRFFYFRTPQFVYYVIPMSMLVAALVTVGVMTKNSELLVMRACGISLYRSAAPLVLFGLLGSALLFTMQERVLARSNREADRLERIIRHWPAATTSLNRRWIVGSASDIYHYDTFDQDASRFSNLLVYRVDDASWRLTAMTRAREAVLVGHEESEASSATWQGRQGWVREMAVPRLGTGEKAGEKPSVKYAPFTERDLTLEPPSYFKTDDPIAELMTYGELRDYVTRLDASGASVVKHMVELQRKVAFPFVTVIMTLLAVPFAVTTGRRGAMYGIGLGIVLAIVYWVTMSILAALGKGGLLPPTLAAWAPNMVFGAAAAYGLLTVRT